MLTGRQSKLISLLEQTDSYQTMEVLSKKLGISERTLYSEIRAIKDIGVAVTSKRGEGIRLSNKQAIEKPVLDLDQGLKRRITIMHRLLIKEERITYSSLSEEFYVSKSSVQQDLKFVEKVLTEDNSLSILSDQKGTRIDFSDVEQIVLALHNFNQFILRQQIDSNPANLTDGVDLLASYYPENLVNVCKNVLYTFVRKNVDTISDTYIESFLSLLISLVSQLKEGRHLKKKSSSLDHKQHAFYISNAVKILHTSSLRIEFDYSNGDIEYLSQMLLNYRFEQVPVEKIDDSLVENLVEQVSKALAVDFSEDNQLLEKLKWHIPAMIYRLKFHTNVKNPFTEQIKLEFSVTFNVLWLAMSDFGQKLGVTFNDDEIAFLTIYFQLAIEKIGASRKILVVCPTGQVTSELLINRIKTTLPTLDQVEVASVGELAEMDLNQYDLVLSTVKFANDSNSHFISPFISNEELLHLFNQAPISNLPQTEERGVLIEATTYLTILNQEFSSKEELLIKICERLVRQRFVEADFTTSVLEREELGSTEMPAGVALPHGKSTYVKKTFVAFIKNRRKIKWQNYFIDSVFLIGIAEKDLSNTRRIISNIYATINDEQILHQLRHEKDEKEAVKVFYGKQHY